MGKTRSIVDLLQDSRCDPYRFIYIANRVQLLNELKEDIQKEIKGDMVVHQRSDYEILLDIAQKATPADAFEALLNDEVIKPYYDYLDLLRFRIPKPSTVHKAYRFIKSQAGNDKFTQSNEGKELLRERTREITTYFKGVIRLMKDVASGTVVLHVTEQEKERVALENHEKLNKIKSRFSTADFEAMTKKPVVRTYSTQLFLNADNQRLEKINGAFHACGRI